MRRLPIVAVQKYKNNDGRRGGSVVVDMEKDWDEVWNAWLLAAGPPATRFNSGG